jgi:hypothetical protein
MLYDRTALLDTAGSYAVVMSQQKAVMQSVEAAAEEYRFASEAAAGTIDVAGLSAYSRETAEYWYDVLHGEQSESAPAWDTETLANAIRTDGTFAQNWPENERDKKANAAAAQIGKEIRNAALPLKQLPLSLGLVFVSSRGVLQKAVWLDVLALALMLVMIAAIPLSQRRHPFYVLWYYGVAMATGFLGDAVVAYRLSGQQVAAVFARHGAVLEAYGTALLAALRNMLYAFTVGAFLAGGVLLILFFYYRYRFFHWTHHELTSAI